MAGSEEQRAKWRERSAKYRAKHPDRVSAYFARPEVKEAACKRSSKWDSANKERRRSLKYRSRYAATPTRPRPEHCECCGRKQTGRGVMHLDHDHKSGTFRGWLCFECNTGLGKFGDDLSGVMKAVSYLQNFEESL